MAGVMNSLLCKLAAVLGEEYRLLKGVRKQVQFLESELSSMNTLLRMLADMENVDSLTREWRDKVRELSYDIEDCIDLFLHHHGDAEAGFARRTVRRLKGLWLRHQIGNQIQELKNRVMKESERRLRYTLDQRAVMANTDHISVAIDPRVPALYTEAKGLVATDGPSDEIVPWLMDEQEEVKVVSVVGCGGLGKTTLAMEVYRKIDKRFQSSASVSVSRTLDLKKLLKDVFYQINPDAYRQSQAWEEEHQSLIIAQLRQYLQDKRFLVVIDDIWSIEAWEHVKIALPDNKNKSRIITTTRNIDVAKACCSEVNDHVYKMRALNDADSRRLFFRRIFNLDYKCPPHLEEVSTKILRKCGGLPLAIISIASLLSTKPESKDEWEKLQASIGSSLENDYSLQGIKDILFLSYCDLPYYLKTCLLHISTYPEDYTIKSKELIWKWIAEGFIIKQRRRSLEQVAENYFNELVNRSMIQPIDIEYDVTIQTCRVHDLVLDLIISLSSRENFATVVDGFEESSAVPSKIRRLSMQSCNMKHSTIHAISEDSKVHVRSLNLFGADKMMPSLVGFHALRVLDLQGYDWLQNSHIKNIGSLFQLRYLYLHSRYITEIPEEIGKLKYLETLNLEYCVSVKSLPSSMVQLQKLVRLFVWKSVELPAVEFGNLQALEELAMGRSDNPVRFVQNLWHLTRLRMLSIDGFSLVYRCSERKKCMKLLASTLSHLDKCSLRHLSIDEDMSLRLFAGGMGLVFTPGAMPDLQRLHLDVGASNYGGAEFGVDNLLGLTHLHVEINCRDATRDEVEKMEAAVTLATVLHPSPGVLQVQIRRSGEDGMVEAGDREIESSSADKPYAMNSSAYLHSPLLRHYIDAETDRWVYIG